jgi:hypothetical protein
MLSERFESVGQPRNQPSRASELPDRKQVSPVAALYGDQDTAMDPLNECLAAGASPGK